MGTFITTSSRGNMHPLAFQGLLAVECHSQLMELVRPRLDDSYVLLFASPEIDAERETVDWYSPVQGQVSLLSDAPPERQDVVRAELKKMGLELRKLAETLKDSGESQRVIGGNLLELALCYPDESCIRMVGDQPVIICWGFGPSSSGAQPQELSRLAVDPVRVVPPQSKTPSPVAPIPAEIPPQPVTAEREERSSGLFWLLPLLLLLLLLAVLFVSWCGRPPLVRLPGVDLRAPTFFCPEDPAAAALRVELDLRSSLTAEQDSLRAQVEQCTAKSKTVEVPARNNELTVPEQAAVTGDLRFMRGVWSCDTGLSSSRTGLPVIVEYTFDVAGKGTISIKGDKGLCSASVDALVTPEGVLVIESAGEISCPKGTPYSGQRVECSGKGAETACIGRNLSSGAQAWKAVFQRKNP